MEIDHAAERRAAPKIRKEAYGIDVDLGMGKGSYYLYFSDLNQHYVRINAGYRT
jgi:N-acetylglutamate synthase/N-acetylornithine aminotransferase